jgi:7-cyano-7-deazaguanine reductase
MNRPEDHYDPGLLVAVPRETNRLELGISGPLPFSGVDTWTAYELSWLNSKGKPEVAIAQFVFPSDSSALIESKSFKLYLNSFQQTRLSGPDEIRSRLLQDLTKACGTTVDVLLALSDAFAGLPMAELHGQSIDAFDVEIDQYSANPNFLFTAGEIVEETLTSCLLKTNCPITGQPDWGSVQVHYRGTRIDGQGLLQYIVSLRQHSAFAEHCVERIFMEILGRCHPEALTVYARYTRRGGIDINPFRTNEQRQPPGNVRTARQ